MSQTLRDHVIVIVGGTTGLGLSAARACVADGARVVLVGRSESSARAAQETIGETARTWIGDATDVQCAEQAIELGEEAFGRFDGLYHVAGGSGRSLGDGPLHEMTTEGIKGTLDLNLLSLMYSNRAAAQRLMSLGRSGSILNMGSVLGSSPSPQFFATHAYAAAKSAVVGLTKAAAAYYASHSIRFNVIAPGLVDTPMARRAAGDKQIQRFIANKQPLDGGRIGQPQDLDDAVVFLLSNRSRFVTGQVLTVDGGWSVSEQQVTNE